MLSPLFGRSRRLQRTRLALISVRSEDPTEDPVVAAHSFVRDFSAAYGARHPRFLECSYRDALQRAQQESKFLLLYLHSSVHQARHAASVSGQSSGV